MEKNKTDKKPSFYQAIGRRREATARVRLHLVSGNQINLGDLVLKKGDIIVNGRSVEKYFPGEIFKRTYLEPFRTTNALNRFAATVKVAGGGLKGQIEAVLLGMSRALILVDPERNRPILKKRGFLRRDARAKQRRKAGFAHKSRARKQSPKR